LYRRQDDDTLTTQFLVQVVHDVEIPIDLHVPRRLQELGHLKDLLLGRPLEVEELPDRRFAGVHRDELNANAVTEFFP
jgi:hypothetical protein